VKIKSSTKIIISENNGAKIVHLLLDYDQADLISEPKI